MADHQSGHARRRFLQLAIGAAAVPACTLAARRLRAQEKVDPGSELAQDVNYVEDASAAAGHPDYEEGEYCADCTLFHAEESAEWGPCDIFGGGLVAAQGWCTAFVRREA